MGIDSEWAYFPSENVVIHENADVYTILKKMCQRTDDKNPNLVINWVASGDVKNITECSFKNASLKDIVKQICEINDLYCFFSGAQVFVFRKRHWEKETMLTCKGVLDERYNVANVTNIEITVNYDMGHSETMDVLHKDNSFIGVLRMTETHINAVLPDGTTVCVGVESNLKNIRDFTFSINGVKAYVYKCRGLIDSFLNNIIIPAGLKKSSERKNDD